MNHAWNCIQCGVDVTNDDLRMRLVDDHYAFFCPTCMGTTPPVTAPVCAEEIE